jgi:hypothetical protein
LSPSFKISNLAYNKNHRRGIPKLRSSTLISCIEFQILKTETKPGILHGSVESMYFRCEG